MRYLLLLFFLLLLVQPVASQDFSYFKQRQEYIISKFPESLTIVTSERDDKENNLNFYYLTGRESENSVFILNPKSENKSILFTDDKLRDFPGKILPRGKYESYMKNLVRDYDKVNTVNNYHIVFENPDIFRNVSQINNINENLVYMRIIKDSSEITNLREACRITAEGLNKVFRNAKLGMTEKELIEIMENYFKENGSSGSSFYQAASGQHSVNYHFGATSRKIQQGDIVVFDIGAWYNNYTADISRTMPAGGKFTEPQKEIYKAVLDAQKAAIRKMQPEARLLDVQKVAEDKLIEGLHTLGLILDPDSEWQQKFFIQHGFYHFIGLHVHDVWYDYRETLKDKVYKPGMIMTMEPGVYFPNDMIEERPQRIKNMVSEKEFKAFVKKIRSVYERYAGMGVRIEDDILITEDGNEVLTKMVPKEIDEIEKIMR